MMVYGDPQFEAKLPQAITWLIHSAQDASPDALDSWRALLIQAGQLEQALADQPPDSPPRQHWLHQAELWTDAFASAFLRLHRFAVDARTSTLQAFLKSARDALAAVSTAGPGVSSAQLQFKVPEGYEFYSLFPEQYARAVESWHADHPISDARGVLVVGIRAIGTSLSAMVAAALRHQGWSVRRLTVRPHGHPFDRRVDLPSLVGPLAAALVVDEGPGLSGSSMAAVGRALADQGLSPSQISFFPGHPGLPGPDAPSEVRPWWHNLARYCAPLDVTTSLKGEAERLLGEPVAGFHDLGAGAWRAFAYRTSSDWPAVAARFEAPKFLCRSVSGAQLLWKFVGLGSWTDRAETASDRITRSAAPGSCAANSALRVYSGFAAQPWIDGSRLSRQAASDPALLALAAQHIVAAAREPLTPPEQDQALHRLRVILEQNVRESLGAAAAERACAACPPTMPTGPASGDGHLAPHEWLRTARGDILKTDAWGLLEHTFPGKQNVLWDVAGFIVEWALDPFQRGHFLSHLGAAGCHVDLSHLRFHSLAYAAFRLGQFTFSFPLASAAEHHRLSNACDYYLAQLQALAA